MKIKQHFSNSILKIVSASILVLIFVLTVLEGHHSYSVQAGYADKINLDSISSTNITDNIEDEPTPIPTATDLDNFAILNTIVDSTEQAIENAEEVLVEIEQQIEEELDTDGKPSGFVYSNQIPLSYDLQLYTYERCMEENLDYPIVLGLIWRESRFKASAIGYNTNGTLDSGIMQINDVNKYQLQRDLGITNLMDPKENILAGTSMLGELSDKYGQHYALMAYQAGEQGMLNKKAAGITTNNLVEIVYTKSAEFEKILENAQQM